jgi:lysyl-tRNA synthetase class II
MKLDLLVCKVITMPNIDHFTVVEIRTAYMALSDNASLDRAIIRKFVYAELSKLVKRGWLSKSTSDVKGISRFKKTKLFDSAVLKETSEDDKQLIVTKAACDLQKQLKSLLKDCNIELLKGLGALETYLSLWQRYPLKADTFKNKYIAVQEGNHILEGKIKALEDILKNN